MSMSIYRQNDIDVDITILVYFKRKPFLFKNTIISMFSVSRFVRLGSTHLPDAEKVLSDEALEAGMAKNFLTSFDKMGRFC